MADLDLLASESLRLRDFVYGAAKVSGDLSAGLLESIYHLRDGHGTGPASANNDGLTSLVGVLHIQDTVTAQLVMQASVTENVKVVDGPPTLQLDPLQVAASTENVKISDSVGVASLAVTVSESLRLRDFVYGASLISGGLSAGLLESVYHLQDGGTVDQGISALVGVVHIQDTVFAALEAGAVDLTVTVAAENLKLADAVLATLDPLHGVPATESLKVIDQTPVGRLDPLQATAALLDSLKIADSLPADPQLDPLQRALLTESLVVQDTLTAQLVSGGVALGQEVLLLSDGPVLAQLTVLLATVGDETLKLADTLLAGADGLQVAVGTESLKIADTVSAQLTVLQPATLTETLLLADTLSAQLTVLQVAVTAENLKITDGPAAGNVGGLIGVTDPAFFCSPDTTYSDGGGALAATNVKAGSTYVQTNNPGWELKTVFSGTSVAIALDVSPLSGQAANQYPYIAYSVDGAALTRRQLLSSDTTVTLATGLANTTHTLRVVLAGAYDGLDRWNTPISVLRVLGLVLNVGAVLSAPSRQTASMIVFGDSVTEGVGALNAGSVYADQDATASYGLQIAAAVSAEAAIIAFSSQGYAQVGAGNVPIPNSSYDDYYASHSRLSGGRFTPAPDWIVVNFGINGSTTQADVQTFLTSLRAAAPCAMLCVLVPWSGNAAATLAAAVTAQADPKCFLVNTGTTSYSANGLHLTVAGHTSYANDIIPLLRALTISPCITSTSESLKLAESVQSSRDLTPPTLTDSLKIADTVLRTLDPLETTNALSDSLKISETVSGRLDPIQVAVNDENVRIADAVSQQLTVLQTAVLETVLISDAVSASMDALSVSVAVDSLKIADTLTAQLTIGAGVTESLKITDTVNTLLNPEVAAPSTDALKVSDAVTVSLNPLQVTATTETIKLVEQLQVVSQDFIPIIELTPRATSVNFAQPRTVGYA